MAVVRSLLLPDNCGQSNRKEPVFLSVKDLNFDETMPDQHDIRLTIKPHELPWEAVLDVLCMSALEISPYFFRQEHVDRLREAVSNIEQRMELQRRVDAARREADGAKKPPKASP